MAFYYYIYRVENVPDDMGGKVPDMEKLRRQYRTGILAGCLLMGVAAAVALLNLFVFSSGSGSFRSGVVYAMSAFLFLFGLFIVMMARMLRRAAQSGGDGDDK